MSHRLPVLRPLAPALRARLLGAGLVVVAALVLLSVLATWLLSLPGAVVTVTVILAAVALGVLLALLLPRHWVVRLDEDGYRVRLLRSARARSARWSEVLDVQAGTVDGVRCTTLRLRDGRSTTLPVDALAGDPTELTSLIAEQLDRTHGYRRLR
ncbi:hypothetical protein [Nocardioides aequoreus]|uniref:hypothetical protein n=1 Tax=Nocardioides aequoreus TaxID=397278 RepID=UPI00068EEB33|nr:hypothetical protein [Nocardioides aequoreus]